MKNIKLGKTELMTNTELKNEIADKIKQLETRRLKLSETVNEINMEINDLIHEEKKL